MMKALVYHAPGKRGWEEKPTAWRSPNRSELLTSSTAAMAERLNG
jgi:hypothetical protein